MKIKTGTSSGPANETSNIRGKKKTNKFIVMAVSNEIISPLIIIIIHLKTNYCDP